MDTEAKTDMESKKVLSQWEIDSLLGSLNEMEGEEPSSLPQSAKNVRPYDFRRPDKFSKDQLRALQTIHESFARGAGYSLSSHLRTTVQVRLSSIEQAVYGEYMQQLANPTVVSLVRAEPLPGVIVIEVNFGIALALIDRLLGGTGRIIPKLREMTDIEFALLQALVRTLLSSLQESWAQMNPVALTLDDLVFNPQTVQAALPGEIGVLILLELRLGETSNIISMFIPYTTLEPIIGKLSSQIWLAGAHREAPNGHQEARRQLEKVDLPIVVNLGTAAVSIKEMLGLQKGNVIRLDTATHQELQVLVGGKHKYWSRPGRVGRKLAVTVTRALREDTNKSETLETALVGGAQ